MNAMLDWLVDGVLLATVASVVALVIPVNAASQRYVYWWLVLAAILGLPFLPMFSIDVERVVMPAREVIAAPAHSAAVSLPFVSPVVLRVLCALWFAVAVTRSLGLVRSLRRIRQLTDASIALPPEYVRRFRLFRQAQSGSREVMLRVTTAFRGACAVGYRRPSILVSSTLTERLNPDEVEAVVLHEYAHLQRYDDWACLVQAVLRVTVGLHPAVWWVLRQLDIEREASCDRLVVQRTQAPVAYVRALTAAADLTLQSAGAVLHLAPGLTLSSGGFQSRMRRLIEAPVPSRLTAWSSAVVAALSLVMVVAVTEQLPPLVTVGADVAVSSSELAAVSALVARAESMVQTTAVAEPDIDAPLAAVPPSTPQVRHAERRASVPSVDVTGAPTPVEAAGTDQVSTEPSTPSENAAAQELAAREAAMSLAPLVEPPQPLDALAPGIGERTANFGTVAGGVAAHAGQSLGRFFSRGGRAVAQRF